MFELVKLPFEYDALEPVISSETMHEHHDKHHQTYVNNLNNLLEGTELESLDCPKKVLESLDKLPEDKKQAVINNAGGVYNHNLLWEFFTPGGAKEPVGEVAEKINEKWGSFDEFKKEFVAAEKGRFGSGWAWLVVDNGELKITTTKNQDSPVLEGQTPIYGNDLWEHAFYIDYKSDKGSYYEKVWDVLNWDKIEEKYQESK